MNIFITIIVVAVLFVVTVIFSVKLQTAVMQALQLAGVILQGTWRRIIPNIVTFLRTGRRVARGVAITLLVLWALNILAFSIAGYAVEAMPSGVLLGIFLPIFSFFCLLLMFQITRRMAVVPVVLLSILLVVPTICFSIGVYSPELKENMDRLHENQKQGLVYSLIGRSAASEAEIGVIRTMSENSCVYDADGMMIDRSGNRWRIFKGSKIKVMNPNKKPISINGSEGMIRVMLMNEGEEFHGGYIVYVPSRKINWNG